VKPKDRRVGMVATSPPKQIYVRLDDELLAKVDNYAEALAAKQPGLKPSRSDAIRVLLYKGLEAEELDKGVQR
jgi:metal-responsive CopG/Arc/MetJ family transcriptional regulator